MQNVQFNKLWIKCFILNHLPIEICLRRNMRKQNAILVVVAYDDVIFFFLLAILVIFQNFCNVTAYKYISM